MGFYFCAGLKNTQPAHVLIFKKFYFPFATEQQRWQVSQYQYHYRAAGRGKYRNISTIIVLQAVASIAISVPLSCYRLWQVSQYQYHYRAAGCGKYHNISTIIVLQSVASIAISVPLSCCRMS
jgi:hypothetical protein